MTEYDWIKAYRFRSNGSGITLLADMRLLLTCTPTSITAEAAATVADRRLSLINSWKLTLADSLCLMTNLTMYLQSQGSTVS